MTFYFLFTLNSYVAADIAATSMQRYAGADYVYFNSIASFRLLISDFIFDIINPDAVSHGYDYMYA